jgi:DNA-binding transcriptional MerR regulator
MGSVGLSQIGEVAERTRLSLRTIRYYEEVGLVVPSARSQGGFRLFTEADIKRLLFIRRLKPLDLSLDQVRELLVVIDALDTDTSPAAQESAGLRSALEQYLTTARSRGEVLREQLAGIEEFTADLTQRIRRLSDTGTDTPPHS